MIKEVIPTGVIELLGVKRISAIMLYICVLLLLLHIYLEGKCIDICKKEVSTSEKLRLLSVGLIVGVLIVSFDKVEYPEVWRNRKVIIDVLCGVVGVVLCRKILSYLVRVPIEKYNKGKKK